MINPPVQKFNGDLAEIGEISARLARSRRDYRDLAQISARFVLICIRSRRDKRDLAEINEVVHGSGGPQVGVITRYEALISPKQSLVFVIK